MSVKLQITVTKEILERTKNCSTDCKVAIENCAIALAVRDVFPSAKVWGNYIDPGKGFFGIILLPKPATEFICQFDDHDPEERAKMEPVSFEIEISDAIIEKINIDEIRPLLENHATLKLI